MKITEEKINTISSNLKKIPPKNKFSAREAIEKLSGDIQELKKKGYSLNEINFFLEKEGLKISAATLRSYMPSAKKRQKKVNKTDNFFENKKIQTEEKKDEGFVKPDPEEL